MVQVSDDRTLARFDRRAKEGSGSFLERSGRLAVPYTAAPCAARRFVPVPEHDHGLVARLGNDRRGVTLTLTNLFDAKGNRFALGTPFDSASGGFVTPQRPRTINLAFDLAF